MKTPWARAGALLAKILDIGLRAILIVLAIEFMLFLAACGIGVVLWIKIDFLTGLASGLLVFAAGQAFAGLLLDLIFDLPDRQTEPPMLPSDDEALNSLKAEILATAGQDPPAQ